MNRVLVMFALALMMFAPLEASDYFCNKKVIDKVEAHTAIVLGYYENEYGTYTISYGAGGVMENNLIITVSHIVDNDNYILKQAWITVKGTEEWIKADIVAMGHPFPADDDYAVLRPEKDLGLPGLKIAKKPLGLLQKVLFAGTPGGAAFFVRGGYVTMFQYYVNREGESFALLKWADTPSPTVYIGYPGDSGGIITNTKGEIQSVMTWGARGKCYVVGNSVVELRRFLEEHNLLKVKKQKKIFKADPDFRAKFTKWLSSPQVRIFLERYKREYPEAYMELLLFLKGQL